MSIGILVVFVIGLNDIMRIILDPLIEIYQPVMLLVDLSLMVIWSSLGKISKILLISLTIFAPATMSAVARVRSVARVRVRAPLTLGTTRWQMLCFVTLLSALPEMLIDIRI